MDQKHLVDLLNRLIEIAEDSHEAYRHAAEDAADPVLKTFFNELSAERGAIVRDLQGLVAEMGGQPAARGSLRGEVQRFFVDLKAAVLGRNREAIVAEVEQGEDEAIRRFEQALEGELPSEVAGLISQHLLRLRLARDRLAAVKQGRSDRRAWPPP